VQAKAQKYVRENDENKEYDEMAEEHYKLQEQREIEKANAVMKKIMNDK
jgi:hypothetical protein